jgi:hypothetical protein
MRVTTPAAAVLLALALSGCAAIEQNSCPAGQERLRRAQLFFGRSGPGAAQVSDADWRGFMDAELTPRFPDGLTVLDGGGQWRGSKNRMIREASKVVMIVMPRAADGEGRLVAARSAYKRRFHQDSVLLVTQPACVSF